MQVATITMPREEAQAKLESYREQLRRRSDAEYEAVAAGYAALAEGTPLLNLTETIRTAPVDDKGRPKLAVARADRTRVRLRWGEDSTVAFFDAHVRDRYGMRRGRRSSDLEIQIDMGRRPILPEKTWAAEGEALVPMVPADVRRQITGQLSGYLVFWEVLEWLPTPPVDPYLLRHIGGELYAVTAEWDLTELERAIMAGR